MSCRRKPFGTQLWCILTSRFLTMVTNTLCYPLFIVPLIMSFNQLLRQMRKFVDCGPILLFDRLLCKLLEKSFVVIYKVKLICFLLRLSQKLYNMDKYTLKSMKVLKFLKVFVSIATLVETYQSLQKIYHIKYAQQLTRSSKIISFLYICSAIF